MASGVKGRAWRSAFGALRHGGSSEAAAAREFLMQAPSLVRSAPDLPVQEVSGDIALLVEVVSTHWEFPSNAESAFICSRVCHLVQDVSSYIQLEFRAPSALVVSRFLREIIERCRPNDQKEAPEGPAQELYFEALNALAQFVHTNGHQLSSEEANALLLSLVPFITYQRAGSKDVRTRKGSGFDSTAFIVVGDIFTRAGPSILKETWQTVIQGFRKVLDYLGAQIVEDTAASRYYAALLRSLHLVLSDAKGSLDEHVGAFMASLRMFLAYGLPGSRLKRLSDTSNQSGAAVGISKTVAKSTEPSKNRSSLYRPPHLRGRQQDNACNAEPSGSTTDEPEKRTFLSDSEQSDNDGSIDSDHFRSSKVRTNAVLSIQAIARVDPKLLHAHWSLLLPTHNVLHPRLYQPTLLATLLFDPVLKTRIAAASAVSGLLEGPARAFLQVAEYKESGRTASFTTLSSSLGEIVMQLYKGLLHLVSNESHGGILVAILKALALLVSATPFDRLPAGVLPDVICTVHKRIYEISSSSDQTLMVSGLNCLSAGLNASSASSQVSSILVEQLSGSFQAIPNSSWRRPLFLDLISLAKFSTSPAVCIEALQALKAAIHSHGFLASQYWSAISEVVQEVVEHESALRLTESQSPKIQVYSRSGGNQSTAKIVDDKTAYHALKLLDESLRVISGFKGADDMFDTPMLPPSPSQLPQPMKLLSLAERSTINNDVLKTDTAGSSQWLEALKSNLRLTLMHPVPVVRAAALTCFAGLTPAVYSTLLQADQIYIFSTVINAAAKDETPSVRSAACRALGVMVGFSEIFGRDENITSAVATVQASIADASLSVRITSCWALANICDALRKSSLLEQCNFSCDAALLNSLADIALRAAKDGDKVRANAVRALGNLARFVDFTDIREKTWSDDGKACPILPAHCWLGRMVQTLVSCITTGNVKVQWNVCHALGNLFLNRTISLKNMTWASSVYSILLLLLRDSGNFKIRIHAASALAVPCGREDFGESYGDVVHGLVHALESLDSEHGLAPSSFKYISTLSEQLTTTCLRVLSFALPEDYTTLKDFLHKRATFLFTWLQSVISSASRNLGDEVHAASYRMEEVEKVIDALGNMYQHGGEKSLNLKIRSLLMPELIK